MKTPCSECKESLRTHGGMLRLQAFCVDIVVCTAVFLTAGCQSGNHYYAKSMPNSLRLTAQSNPQEADLSRLASASGGSQTIGRGDVLEISIAASLSKDDQFTMKVRVAEDGTAQLPDIGYVMLAGVEPQAAEALIGQQAVNKGYYRNPTVTVSSLSKKMNRVRVIGAVKEPSTYELPPGESDVVSAIAAAGGLAENAGENVEVRNPNYVAPEKRPIVAGDPEAAVSTVSATSSNDGMKSYTINLVSAAKAGTNKYVVEDGGVVMVEKRDPAPVKVGGLVHKPDEYDFPVGNDLTVLGAISLAGGTNNQLADKVYVIRPLVNSEDPAVIQVSLRKAKKMGHENILLGPGDIVWVEQTTGTVIMEALQLVRFGISGSAPLF
ncbi:MAG: hypothetical protein GY758_00110 [Fuerstiella sp.]|nr:hypothetical protein [Fuerstiella sp.]MCP4507972.1 hypothetical protein [Fuerstiella sp.]